MRIGRVLFCALLVLSQFQFVVPSAHAIGSQNIVISHVIVGETSSSSSELIAIYNNADTDIDVSNFCLKNKSLVTVACVAPDTNGQVYIRSHGYLTVASSIFSATHNYTADTNYTLTNAVQVGGDDLTLLNDHGDEVDRVTWGTSGGGISAQTNGTLQRKVDPVASNRFVDTDAMANDFTSLTTLTYPTNASYDVVTIVDVCANIPDVQQQMPVGYLSDENGQCLPDSCLNIAGLQISVPDNFDANADGTCVEHDECDNLSGIQTIIPEMMIRSGMNDCTWNIPQLRLTEILPNAIGSDTGNEFIEIYNPTNQTVDLSFYSVKTGIDSDKAYAFPIGSTIGPGEYRSFTDSVMKFTLLNTSSRVVLMAIDDGTLGDTGVYDSPGDGESWALIHDMWQYTNQPTPGAENKSSLVSESSIDTTDTVPMPCSAGKYRNSLTGRCRNIVADASILATCDVDQYRNPETGRCKKITTTMVAPCKDGQYRSEETNRCRNIVAASVIKPCKDSQYRSEESGRCRNLPIAAVPDAAYAVRTIKDTGMVFVGWWALGAVGLLALGYGVWEWRRDIATVIQRYFQR